MMRLFSAVLISVLALGSGMALHIYEQIIEDREAARRAITTQISYDNAMRAVWAVQVSAKRQGSAVAVTKTELVTAAHVVRSTSRVLLTQPESQLRDKTIRRWASVTHVDPRRDLAVLTVDEPLDTPPIRLVERTPAQHTDVMAVGYPGNMGHLVVTLGKVSALVETPTLKNTRALLTSAPMAHGNSGGALISLDPETGRYRLAGISHVVRTLGNGRFSLPVWHLSLFIPAEAVTSTMDCAIYDVKSACFNDINSLSYHAGD